MQPVERVRPVTRALVVRQVEEDEGGWARAGYIPGLTRYFGSPVEGNAYHFVTDEGNGYETSNVFAQYPTDDDEPVRLVVPDPIRVEFETLVERLVAASAVGRCLLVFEDNGHVTSPDLTSEEEETIDVVGPLNLAEFWRLLELGQLVEDSIIILEG